MRLLSLQQVMARLGCSGPTARKIRRQLPGQQFPGAVRVGGRLKYREDAIEDFILHGGGPSPDTRLTETTAA
jgi:predicted DNA-binding transcriptional regulator AlpA